MTKEEAVGVKAQEWVGEGKNPHVLEVTEGVRADFELRSKRSVHPAKK